MDDFLLNISFFQIRANVLQQEACSESLYSIVGVSGEICDYSPERAAKYSKLQCELMYAFEILERK